MSWGVPAALDLVTREPAAPTPQWFRGCRRRVLRFAWHRRLRGGPRRLRADHEGRTKPARRLPRRGRAPRRRSTAKAVGDAIEELSRHAEIEELVFYPAVRAEVDDAKADVLEALEEHHVVKWLLHELEDLDASDEQFDAKVTVMMENVRHHVKEEEHELLPEVRAQIGRKRLLELGAELRDATSRVPTRPRRAALDRPPGNVLGGGGAVAASSRAPWASVRSSVYATTCPLAESLSLTGRPALATSTSCAWGTELQQLLRALLPSPRVWGSACAGNRSSWPRPSAHP